MNNATAQPHFQTTPIPQHSDLRNIGGNGISRFDAEEIKEMKEMNFIEQMKKQYEEMLRRMEEEE